ncbi:MAG TPA: hypothetical protein VFN26_06100 [Candidatus Acidoferrum sp.]|nr:hypothetical protein [Candidatus Acidoferrum sp.]
MVEEASEFGGVSRAARVTETGIALVHRGELILPAAGSEAQAETVSDDVRSVIHYHFPVEIEVKAAPDAVHPDVIVERTLLRLARGIKSL